MQEIWLMAKNKIQKIAVVGPESTGKSTMATYLANHFDTLAIPEYSRYYCEDLNREYTLQDEVNMFYGQVALEEALLPLAHNHLVICDTTILTVKIWCDHLFQHTPEKILKEIQSREYTGYLLMDIDLPWEDDPLRDFPEKREYFMSVWKKELDALRAPYIKVSGLDSTRQQNGLAAAQKLLSTHNE